MTDVSLSPDGAWMAVVIASSSVVVCSTRQSLACAPIPGRFYYPRAAFDARSAKLLVHSGGDGGDTRIWDVDRQRLGARIGQGIRTEAWDAQGDRVAMIDKGGRVTVHDLQSGATRAAGEIDVAASGSSRVSEPFGFPSLVWRPDGKAIAVFSGRADVFDIETGRHETIASPRDGRCNVYPRKDTSVVACREDEALTLGYAASSPTPRRRVLLATPHAVGFAHAPRMERLVATCENGASTLAWPGGRRALVHGGAWAAREFAWSPEGRSGRRHRRRQVECLARRHGLARAHCPTRGRLGGRLLERRRLDLRRLRSDAIEDPRLVGGDATARRARHARQGRRRRDKPAWQPRRRRVPRRRRRATGHDLLSPLGRVEEDAAGQRCGVLDRRKGRVRRRRARRTPDRRRLELRDPRVVPPASTTGRSASPSTAATSWSTSSGKAKRRNPVTGSVCRSARAARGWSSRPTRRGASVSSP